MSVTFSQKYDNIVVVIINGIFTFDEQKEIEAKLRQTVQDGKKLKLLINACQFTGWGKEGDWGDLTFMYERDRFIEKIAVVTEEKWRDQMLMFLGVANQQESVEFYFPNELDDALEWLKSE